MTGKLLWRYARPYRGRLLLISLLTLAASASLLAAPWLAGLLLGGVVEVHQQPIALITALLIAALAGTTLFSIAAAVLTASVAAGMLADLREDVHGHVLRLPMAFHDASRQGDLIALMTYEVGILSNFLTTTLAQAPATLLTSAGAMVMLFVIDPLLALVVPLLIPLFYLLLKLLGRHLREYSVAAREAEAEVYAEAESQLDVLLATKSFATEETQSAHYARLVDAARRLSVAREQISAMLGPVIGLVAAIAAVLVILLADRQFGTSDKSATELFSFLLYAALLTRPVRFMADLYGQVQMTRGALVRMGQVMTLPIEPGYLAGLDPGATEGRISFRDIRFAYPGRPQLLSGLDLEIAAGETVALVGENGCGKTTLARLLMRLYQPDSGTILLDGTDIAGLQLQQLRRRIGYVPQRAMLFNASLRDNVAFGAPQVDDQGIIRALDLAQASEFVAHLPEGLDTMIGDHGVRLSGGQRQRVALARALLSEPQVLLFDEATAMFDLEGEEALVKALQTSLKDRTVIIVTHRLALLALADRVVRMADGRCEEVT